MPCIALVIACAHAGLLRAEDDENLLNFDVNEDDFSLDGPDASEDSSTAKKTDSTGTEPLENFSTNPDNAELNLSNNDSESVHTNVNETVGLDLKEKKHNDTPKVVHREAEKLAPAKILHEPPVKNSPSAALPSPVNAAPIAEPTLASPEAPVAGEAPYGDTASEEESVPAVGDIVSENDFAGTPFVQGGRRIMALGEAPEYYKVREGDTLFDVCDQLIDEPGYWPKLWALNPGIKNPHFIFPGMVLTFYPGDDATPPYLQVVNEDEILPIETGGLTEEQLVSQPVHDVPEVGESLVGMLEGKFFEATQDTDLLSNDFEMIGSVYEPNLGRMDIPAFFFDEEPEELGSVIAGPKGEIHAIEKDDVVIEVNDGNLALGSLYTIVRPSGRVYKGDGDFLGYRYEFVAQVKVTDKTEDEDALVANVIKSRVGVKPDDLVIPYRSTSRSYNREISGIDSGTTDAAVVGFEYPTQTMGGQGHIVFLDKQFTPGASLPVYQRMEQRLPTLLRISVPNVTSRVGVVRVIDTVGSGSVGIVLKNELDIRVGDRLGRG